ncbi:putative GABA permease [Annulohypoxylon truncatum]|uniref:putative GABA permease n=1 Tax=Annulohypoxylon truncatum TaxID=327061 RepID=UPI002007E3EE|nr:putative GABA permease [Annulohypoxylon truncatum]KAI1213951.1 putative GABA permease [Annulohypoxylon truncatum]
MIGFSFSIVTCWSALGGTLIVGIVSGGPLVMIYAWIGVSLFSLAVAFSFAEMCSAYPVAGGQYSWVAVLAPSRWARGMSWVTGWFMLVGLIANGSVNNFIAANFILGMANLANPDYVIERWHTVVITYFIILTVGNVNIFAPKAMNKITQVILVWNIVSFFVITITMVATKKEKQEPSFVFQEFRNDTGLSAPLGVIAGLLQTFYSMCCYDAPAHMTEEMRNASRDAPKAIVAAVVLGAITGLCFLIAAYFCIGDIDSVANSSTGVPLIQIIYDCTGSVAGTCFLSSLITVILLVCANSIMAEGSRALWAFARDNGLPYSKTISSVHKKFQVPVVAIIICMVIQAALNTIYIGTYTGFNTVISIAAEGFYVSYAIPLLSRLMSHFSGAEVRLQGGYYSLGRWGVPLNMIGACYLLFAAVTFNFPSTAPIDSQNMNYCSAAVGLVMLISAVTWFTGGRKNFTMPLLDKATPALSEPSERACEKEATGIDGMSR